jgi:hypothetical protein
MQTMIDTTNWIKYPFEVNGVKFNSILDPKGSLYPRVEKLPAGVFANTNKEAIDKFVGDPSLLTADEIKLKLNLANDGASQALIVLA